MGMMSGTKNFAGGLAGSGKHAISSLFTFRLR